MIIYKFYETILRKKISESFHGTTLHGNLWGSFPQDNFHDIHTEKNLHKTNQ